MMGDKKPERSRDWRGVTKLNWHHWNLQLEGACQLKTLKALGFNYEVDYMSMELGLWTI